MWTCWQCWLARSRHWVTIQQSHETRKTDKRKRQRTKRTGKKLVILVALGFWSDGRGWCSDGGNMGGVPKRACRSLCAMAVGSWRKRSPWWMSRRCDGARAALHLSPVAEWEQESAHRTQRQREPAAAMYQAETATQAQTCLPRWAEQWNEQALQSVATLSRDCEPTLAVVCGLGILSRFKPIK